MTRSGQPAVNLHIKTLKSLAHELAAPEMARKSQSRLAGRGGALVIDAILDELRDAGLTYLARLPPSIGLAEAVYHSILDLRLAGLAVAHLRASHFEDSSKGRDL